MKRTIENLPENKKVKIEKNEKIINIVQRILYFNPLDQSREGLKILTPNQMLSRLSISLAQLNAGNNSKKFKNEIRQLLYSLYRSKKTCKTALLKFDWHYLKMETVFMNTENSKTNEPHRFKLDLTDKLYLKNPNKNMTLAYLSIYYTWENIKSKYNNNKFKISAPTWNDTWV